MGKHVLNTKAKTSMLERQFKGMNKFTQNTELSIFSSMSGIC